MTQAIATPNHLARGAKPARTGRVLGRTRLFWLAVLLPTVVATIYYGVIASKRYASETQFVVRSLSTQRLNGFQLLFKSFGLSPTADDANAVDSYLLSRDAVQALERQLPLREMFGRPDADAFARFPHFYMWPRDTFERLYSYYLERVTVVRDAQTGITTLRAIAFDPKDAQKITQHLLGLAEEMVNRLNQRAQHDAVATAEQDVQLAENRVIAAQAKLTAFRREARFVDPISTSSAILETITSLSTELADVRATLDSMRRSSPSHPGIPAMMQRATALKASIEAERLKIAGDDRALAAKLATFEQLVLEEKLDEATLQSAHTSLEIARQDARKQAIYIEEVVQPNLSDESTEPRRLRIIAATFVTSFLLAAVVWLLVAGTKEHEIR